MQFFCNIYFYELFEVPSHARSQSFCTKTYHFNHEINDPKKITMQITFFGYVRFNSIYNSSRISNQLQY